MVIEGFLRSFMLYLVYFGFCCLLISRKSNKGIFSCFYIMQFRDPKDGYPGNSKDGSYPGNTITMDMDKDNLPAFRRSFKRAIKKGRAWCQANSNSVDISGLFGPGAEVYTTPATGTLHVKLRNKGRELTLFFRGRDLYLKGWRSDRFGLFAAHPDRFDKKDCFIQDKACKHLNIEDNYHQLVPGGRIGKVRVGPLAMLDYFEVLHKCNGIVTTDVLGLWLDLLLTSQNQYARKMSWRIS